MLAVNKAIVYECVCRAQNEEVQPQDYGFAEGDYRSLYLAVVIECEDVCMKNGDGSDYLNEHGARVKLHNECYLDNSEVLASEWAASYQSIMSFADAAGVGFKE